MIKNLRNLCTLLLLMVASVAWADDYQLYSGTITEGDYVIVYDGGAMKASVTSGRLDYAEVAISNDIISSPDASIIWHIAASGDYYTIYNASTSSYAASTGAKNKAQLLTSGTDDMSLWTVSGTATYDFVNKKNTANNVNANLRRNGTYGYACYASGTGGSLSLYKKVETPAGQVATPTISGTTPFYPTTEVSITCTTEGSTIQYSTDEGSTWSDYTGAFTISETTTVQAKATADGLTESETTSKTFTLGTLLSNIAALSAQTEAGTYFVTLTDAVVTYVNGNYAYIQDASGAIVMYKSGHGLTAGNVLNGTAEVTYQVRNSTPQITELSGVTPTIGDAPEPTTLAAADWSSTISAELSKYYKITGATITQTDSKYYITLGSETVQLYGQGDAKDFTLDDLSVKYTIVGFPTLYNTTPELQIFVVPEAESTTRTPVVLTFSAESVEATATGALTNVPTLTVTDNAGNTIEGLSITYASDNTAVADVDATSGAVTVNGYGTATITATFAGNDDYVEATASYTVSYPDPNVAGATAENPYTVAQALAAIDANSGITGVYAKGIVSEIVTAYNSQYGNISYNISDDGLTTSSQLQAYRGKSYNGENFTSADDIQVGDEVVVYGNLKKYNDTYEFDANNQLVSLTRPDTPATITAPSFTPAEGEVEAGTTITINVPEDENVDDVEYSFDQETWTVYNPTSTEITINEETTIYARSVSPDGEYSAVVSATYTIKVAPVIEGKTFVKVTSTDELTDGYYLVVYEEGNLAFNSGLEDLDVAENTIGVAINNGQIVANDANKAAVFSITGSEEGYTLLAYNGKYVGRTSDSNGLNQQDAALYNAITFTESGDALIASSSAVLRYNAASNQNRFRYFKSSTYEGQKPVYLYKLTNEEATAAVNFVLNGQAISELTMSVGDIEENLEVTCTVEGATIFVDSPDKTIAEFSETDNALYAYALGTTTLTATAVDADANTLAEATLVVNVVKKKVTLSFSEPTTTVNINEFVTNAATADMEGVTIVYSSDNEDVAIVDATTGEVGGVAVGTATITATLTDAQLEEYDVTPATYTISVKDPSIVVADIFELVTDGSKLAADDVIIIANVADNAAVAMSTTQNSNNRGVATITVNEDATVTVGEEVQQITLEGNSEGWYFNVGDGYLYAASSSSNHLKTEAEIDENGNAKAIIAIDTDGTASIIFQGTNTRNVLQYNESSSLFACYSSASQKAVQIYKKVATTPHKGDVNGDGSVTIADVTALVNIILGKDNTEPYEYDHEAADVNGEDGITIADVTALVNIILGKE
ncbi:MAG: Ig-like domain-containing protein [Prevotella sp.]|nr:Ig-like domain-containing protein [Prevotella sp.]